MAEDSPIIESSRLGLWVAASFVLAMLSLVVGLVAIKRLSDATVITQTELLVLDQKIEAMRPGAPGMPPAR